jgi:flagellar protein FliL
MSAATAAPTEPAAAAPAVPLRSKKRLILIAAAVLVLAAGGAGAAWVFLHKPAPPDAAAHDASADEDAGDDKADAAEKERTVRAELKNAPTFVPLDPFTVNLADREAERYAQVGMTLELADPKAGDLLKAYMPAIRNNILLTLSSKNAAQLMEHEGKLQLAAELRAAALKPLGYSVRKGQDDDEVPIRAVHFSNFIIQ